MASRVLGSDDRRPYFCKRVHVERQVVEVVLVVDDGAVRVAVELGEAAHIVPDFLVVGMEDVRPVLVHVDPALLVSVDVPRDVSAPLDHEALLPAGCQQVRERRVEQPRAHEKKVVAGMLAFIYGIQQVHFLSPCFFAKLNIILTGRIFANLIASVFLKAPLTPFMLRFNSLQSSTSFSVITASLKSERK